MGLLNFGFKPDDRLKSVDTIDHDERIMCVVFQHQFGLIMIYLTVLACFIIAMVLISTFLPAVFDDSSAYGFLAAFVIFSAILVTVILVAATFVYRKSKLTVTDRNVIQVIQEGIYSRKISQISLANVEDVTAHQRGFFASTLNYGVLKVETAGEQANFIFQFCPNPNRIAKIILDAKDDFLIETGLAGSYRNNVKRAHFHSE